MKIGIDGGHSLIGAVGARGSGLKEEVQARLVVKELTAMLVKKGHRVINCSCDNAATANAQLGAIVAKANRSDLDLFISIHLNAFADSNANGVETYSLSKKGTGHNVACKIQTCLTEQIGWYNRGKKEANFYVLKNTTAPAVLVECGFITNKNDMNKFDPIKIARAIYKGITGEAYSEPKPESCYVVQVGSFTLEENAKKLAEELRAKGYNYIIKKIK